MISKKILTIRINTLDLLDLLVRLADLVICPSYTPFLWNLPLISFHHNGRLRIAPLQAAPAIHCSIVTCIQKM